MVLFFVCAMQDDVCAPYNVVLDGDLRNIKETPPMFRGAKHRRAVRL